MNTQLFDLFVQSWAMKSGVNTIESILSWIDERKRNLEIVIKKIPFEQCKNWTYDITTGTIHNSDNTFFSISGFCSKIGEMTIEQPIIIQNEIGYLGILCRPIQGVLHFLMQAKVEPGNINAIQISPTIQATKSNFTQKHGGNSPAYLNYFLDAQPFQIVVDQIQSEQSSRFHKKRNRNIIVLLEEESDIPVLPSHRWMTLGQIKALMRFDNLVNMDTRTVISCIPYLLMNHSSDMITKYDNMICDTVLLKSIFTPPDLKSFVNIFSKMNNYKMFHDDNAGLIDLFSMTQWKMENDAFTFNFHSSFKIVFCDISIEGREVQQWCQPLFEAVGKCTFGLFCCDDENVRKFLIKMTPEIGCFDKIEIGPTIQKEPMSTFNDEVSTLFFSKTEKNEGILFDSVLSEEGGRFFHEENRNIIIIIDKNEISSISEDYLWCDFATINVLMQFNNCLNIQLRNLLSLLEI
jgi:oxidase EvaA